MTADPQLLVGGDSGQGHHRWCTVGDDGGAKRVLLRADRDAGSVLALVGGERGHTTGVQLASSTGHRDSGSVDVVGGGPAKAAAGDGVDKLFDGP